MCLGMIAALLLSWRLWTGPRFYPPTPALQFFHPLPWPVNLALFAALLVITAWVAVERQPYHAVWVLSAIAAVFAVFDQSRLQPWFYQYVFMMLALGAGALNTCRLIMVCTYFWSGLQKLNANFADDIFVWLAEPVIPLLPARIKPLLHDVGLVAPFVETALAVGLLYKRTRPVAVVLAIGMHVFILMGIGPWGHNSNNVVWPWNLVMIACAVLLFRQSEDAGFSDILWVKHSAVHTTVVVLFGLAPLLSFFNLWDSYLSSSLYTANKNRGTLHVSETLIDKLPAKIQEYATDEGAIDISDWSFGELNVPPYPEIRIFKNIGGSLCANYAEAPDDVRLVVQEKAALIGGGRTLSYDCRQLATANFK